MKETRFPIRTTEEEKARWFDAAKHTPFGSTSAWARFVLNRVSDDPALVLSLWKDCPGANVEASAKEVAA